MQGRKGYRYLFVVIEFCGWDGVRMVYQGGYRLLGFEGLGRSFLTKSKYGNTYCEEQAKGKWGRTHGDLD